ncbi:MAG: hypothetical protein GY866_21340 [Proteobacteria bacterium]|nr:hypothetical protein [Pseudomonadota bacterium]
MSTLTFLLFAGCAKRNPTELRQWYSENYPDYSGGTLEEATVEPEDEVSEREEADSMEDESQARIPETDDSSNRMALRLDEEIANKNGDGFVEMVEGYLDAPRDLKYASEEVELSEYSASSMIEGNLFKLVEKAYARRDQAEFVKLYNFFLESFPHSGRKAYLDEKRKRFFYSEKLDIDKLKEALVEVTYPAAKTKEELSRYFAKLKSNGLGSIQINAVQFLGTPVYLFAESKSRQGYYFLSPDGPLVDDLLSKIVTMAHDNGLRVLVSFPLRHHPLIGHNDVFIMDESWNAFQNRITPNSKLDLLNPQSKIYLQGLIKALLVAGIDGIVFKDDFTYEVNEGFSSVARNRYAAATGKPIVFNKIFLPVKSSANQEFEILVNDSFNDIMIWRTREIKQLLWELIETIRKDRKDLLIGIEATPEMLLDQEISVKWYSTGLHYLRDLKVNFFVLKWRKYDSKAESDQQSFKRAARVLREAIPIGTDIYVKVPLSQDTRNVIQLNRKIDDNLSVLQEIESSKMAIGPVNRLEKTDILY